MIPSRKREEVLNVMLAICLTERGLEAEPETLSFNRKMPDVLLMYRGLRCIIEGKIGDVPNAQQLVQDNARQRVDSGLAHLAIGVVYPEQLRSQSLDDIKTNLNNVQLGFYVHTENGPGPWHEGKLDDIISEIRHAHEIIIRDDVVTRAVGKLSEAIEYFSNFLQRYPAVCNRMIKTLGIGDVSNIKGPLQVKRRITASQIGTLTIVNAMLFQEQLSQTDDRVLPMRKMFEEKYLHLAFIKHWNFIQDTIDYVPIFRIAKDSMTDIPTSISGLDSSLKFLAEKSIVILAEKAALRHDLMGRIYHRLLLEAKYLGTYYTSVPSATLLLKIALEKSKWDVDWSELSDVANFKVGDLACGTGTLLMAANQSILDNYIRSSVEKDKIIKSDLLNNLHQLMMEDVLYGYDVLSSAVHLTASTLAMLAPEIAFQKMKLYINPLGKFGDQIKLGSIDYLEQSSIKVQTSLLEDVREAGSTELTGVGENKSQAPIQPFDLIVMNPPFVRSVGGNLLFGSLPDIRGEMQNDLSKLLKPKGDLHILASSTAGLGSVFTAVADKYIKMGGRIALVLPASILTGVSWEKTRILFAQKYHLEYVITSHDPEKWSFSENTSLSEVLLVARKRELSGSRENEVTKFANLWLNFKTSIDALTVGGRIIRNQPQVFDYEDDKNRAIESLMVGEIKHGELLTLKWNDLCNEPWLGGAYAQTDLTRTAWFLNKGKLVIPGYSKIFEIPICKLSSLGVLGPDGRDIHDAFKEINTVTPYPAFWGRNYEETNFLYSSPNKFLEPLSKPKKNRPFRPISLLIPKAGNILISDRIRLNTQSIFAILIDTPVLSNVWWPLKTTVEKLSSLEAQKAIVLWLNSTLALIIAIANRVPTEGSWVQFKKPILKNMTILDFEKLSKRNIKTLSNLFDQICKERMMPFPQMDQDPIRTEIDKAFCKILNIPSVAILIKMLAREPIITNERIIKSDD
jgi:hypothetical protein